MRSSPKIKSREDSASFIEASQKKQLEATEKQKPQELSKVQEVVPQKQAKTLLSMKSGGKAFLIVFHIV